MDTQAQEQVEQFEPIGDATYSPEDNKIRIFPYERLDNDDYQRLKAAGYKWGRFQQNFVAPMWTPTRWDLAVELCGEVGDDTQTTEERAAQRVDRFERYKANRHRDAARAEERVEMLTGGEEIGSSVIIGGNDARKAERTARKIERSMSEVVDQWSRADYWTERIPAVRRHAEFKASAGLRARRIKELEKDERRQTKERDKHLFFLDEWNKEGLTYERAYRLAYGDSSNTLDLLTNPNENGLKSYDMNPEQPTDKLAEAIERATKYHSGPVFKHWDRWLKHTQLRLSYERQLLHEQVGHLPTVEDRFPDMIAGGMVKITRNRGEWVRILRVNKTGGKINSITTEPTASNAQWTKQAKHAVGEVEDYQQPTTEDIKKAKATRAPLPLCNYDGEGFLHMTSAAFKSAKGRDNVRIKTNHGTENVGAHRYRTAWRSDLSGHFGGGKWERVFITDMKVKPAPTVEPKPPTEPEPTPEPPAPKEERMEQNSAPLDLFSMEQEEEPQEQAEQMERPKTKAEQYREILESGGIKTVTATDLYPTPGHIAKYMVELANIQPEQRILEPSAGTGAILARIGIVPYGSADRPGQKHSKSFKERDLIVAVEQNAELADRLQRNGSGGPEAGLRVENEDFLTLGADTLGTFDAVLMNPPFSNGADIKHINHAFTFLRPGGVLVAICANGPRQQREFMERAEHWEELPAGTFKAAGTMVNTALLVLRKD